MDFIRKTINLAKESVVNGGRPFACVIVRDGEILAEGVNEVVQTNDPTAHAEIVAIRKACAKLGSEDLSGCDFYILAHPCPMCLGAMYYCNPDRVIFITQREDYARYYTDDRKYFSFGEFYQEFSKSYLERKMPMTYRPDPKGIEVYKLWQEINS
jgi:tRNA(Arg) A34 adenosine deaminase TadA